MTEEEFEAHLLMMGVQAMPPTRHYGHVFRFADTDGEFWDLSFKKVTGHYETVLNELRALKYGRYGPHTGATKWPVLDYLKK